MIVVVLVVEVLIVVVVAVVVVVVLLVVVVVLLVVSSSNDSILKYVKVNRTIPSCFGGGHDTWDSTNSRYFYANVVAAVEVVCNN